MKNLPVVLAVLLGAFFMYNGISKFSYDPAFKIFTDKLTQNGWLAIGIAEIAGAFGLFIPRLRKSAAQCLGFLMSCAIVLSYWWIPNQDWKMPIMMAAAALLLLTLLLFFSFKNEERQLRELREVSLGMSKIKKTKGKKRRQ